MKTTFVLLAVLVLGQNIFGDENNPVNSAIDKLPKNPAQMKVLSKEPVKLNGENYTLVFKGYGEFCDYDQVDVLKAGKKIASLKKRCGRESKLKGDYVLSQGKFSSIVKIGPSNDDIYIYLFEEPSNYVYKTSLFQIKDGQIKQTYSDKVYGSFSDRTGDGYLDITKEGGHGEPSGDDVNSYDPYLVYVQSKRGDSLKFTLDESLSKKLSLENDFEWHGKAYDEKIKVNSKGHIVHQ
jgi:hypothetical protein